VEPRHVLIGITAAGFVGNNSEPFSQGLSKFICFSGHWLELKLSLGRAEAKLPFSKAAADSRRALKNRQVRAGLAFETAVPCFWRRSPTDFNIVPQALEPAADLKESLKLADI
jgi:hypothetical protein